jgi:hypothetical protein
MVMADQASPILSRSRPIVLRCRMTSMHFLRHRRESQKEMRASLHPASLYALISIVRHLDFFFLKILIVLI